MQHLLTNNNTYVTGTGFAIDAIPAVVDSIAQTVHGCVILPGFCDVHVHLREPGFSYKETIASGTLASARGGCTDVCSMPNLNPVPDSLENLQVQLDLIKKDAVIHVHPLGAITVGEKGKELADLKAMAPDVIGFSDDGRGVNDEVLLREAMKQAKALDLPVVAHCEDLNLVNGGVIHDGDFAKKHGYPGINSESEWKPIEMTIRLAEETGCKLHICHISTKESVEVIRQAKARGVDVTCETGPHYLLINHDQMQEHARFKMNPPLRNEDDRLALIEGLQDGTIDMIATDHAPHGAEEKASGLLKSPMGVVGIETAFPLLYTYLVRTGKITLQKLVNLMAVAPRKRFNIPAGDSYCVWNLQQRVTVNPDEFMSKGRSTPFEGWPMYGKCIRTVCDGKVVWDSETMSK